MINIQNLTFGYNDAIVLKDISIQFEANHIHGIVGLNGSGKTTFFNVLNGLYKQQSGTIDYQNAALKKNDIAYIDTETFFYPNLTAQEFLNVFTQKNQTFNEQELAKLFNLPLNEFIENYSTGMKKKLLILSQVKQDKQIYIFDEPFNGLDVETIKLLILMIEMLASKGKLIFISSHIIEPLFKLCYKIHYLKDKTFIKSYSQSEFGNIEQEVFGSYIDDLRASLKDVF